ARAAPRRKVAALPGCQVPLSANVSSAAPKHLHDELHARVRAICDAPDLETAHILLANVVADFEAQAPTTVVILECGFDGATAVLALSYPYSNWLRTTNGQERPNEEIRRRDCAIRIFPTRKSAIRLLGALLLEQDEQWSTGKRYLDMSAYWQWREAKHDAQEGGTAVTPSAMSLTKGQRTDTNGHSRTRTDTLGHSRTLS